MTTFFHAFPTPSRFLLKLFSILGYFINFFGVYKLLLALKTANEDIKLKIFKNISQRAANLLKDDLANMGPARLSDVEGAQVEIVNTARRLEAEGKILIALRSSPMEYDLGFLMHAPAQWEYKWIHFFVNLYLFCHLNYFFLSMAIVLCTS